MATPYFGNTLTDLQRGRTASEEIAGRIAMQQIIADAAREEARARAAEANQRNDLLRQQLAQQGAYQQGMFNRYNTDAIQRAANEMFNRELANRELTLREKQATATPASVQVEQLRDKQLAADLAGALPNAASVLNQDRDLSKKLFDLAALENEVKQLGISTAPDTKTEADILHNRFDTSYIPYYTSQAGKDKAGKVLRDLFGRLPQEIIQTNQPVSDNIALARRLFTMNREQLAPAIQSVADQGLVGRLFLSPTGYVANAQSLPMTATATNGAAPAMLTTSNAPPIAFGSPPTNAPVSISGLFPSNTVTANAAPTMSASQPTQPIRSPDGKVAIQNSQGARFWVQENLLPLYLGTNNYRLVQ